MWVIELWIPPQEQVIIKWIGNFQLGLDDINIWCKTHIANIHSEEAEEFVSLGRTLTATMKKREEFAVGLLKEVLGIPPKYKGKGREWEELRVSETLCTLRASLMLWAQLLCGNISQFCRV